MYQKKKKELYYTNTILNFWDSPFSPSVSILCHFLKNAQTSQKNQVVRHLSNVRFIKKQIFLKFLNQISMTIPVHLNGRLLVASSSLSTLDLSTLLRMNKTEFSLIGSNWDTFYFSDVALKMIHNYTNMFGVNSVMELDHKIKEFFVQQLIRFLIQTNINSNFIYHLNKIHLISLQTVLVTPTSD